MPSTALTTLAFRVAPESPIVDLAENQALRRHAIRSQQRLDRATEAILTRFMGYTTEWTPEDRKRAFALARTARVTVERALQAGESQVEGLPSDVFDLIETAYKSRQWWDQRRERIEARMRELAQTLPVAPWASAVRGLGELGLAVIVGETGDLAGYSGPAKVWSRLGLGCVDGTRQGSVPQNLAGDARRDAWKARHYNPSRRAEVWAFVDDVLFRAQWRAERRACAACGKPDRGTTKCRCETPDLVISEPAHPLGPYGAVYAERKEWNVLRGLAPKHADADARRFMAKRLIRDMWVAWQEAVTSPRLMIAEAA